MLDRRPLAIFYSARCPGGLIIQASDLAHALRDRGAAVSGGFHTPVERACLEILLTGAGPLIVCPASTPVIGPACCVLSLQAVRRQIRADSATAVGPGL